MKKLNSNSECPKPVGRWVGSAVLDKVPKKFFGNLPTQLCSLSVQSDVSCQELDSFKADEKLVFLPKVVSAQ